MENTLLRQVKSYIDNNLYPAKVNVVDPTKDNFTQPLHIKETLDKIKYPRVIITELRQCQKMNILSCIWKGNLIPALLIIILMLAWQASTDILPVFNEHKAVTYMYQYFSKTEDQCSQVMKQAAKEAFEKNMHHHDTMKQLLKLT